VKSSTQPTQTPVVSIIMPAYNAEKYISASVASVLEQTLNNWELIIVNDGSIDDTRTYLDALSDSRIKVIHQNNMGVSSARNRALDVVQGEFVTFLDADDILSAGSLEVRVKYLQSNPEVDIVDGTVSVRDESLAIEIRSYQPYYQGELFPRLISLDDRAFFNIEYMLKVDKIGNIRFREDMSHVEDLFFFMQVSCENGCVYGYVTDTVYIYRKNKGSAMTNMEGLEQGYIKLIDVVNTLPCVSFAELLKLRLKIAKTLILSWISMKQFYRSLLSVAKILF